MQHVDTSSVPSQRLGLTALIVLAIALLTSCVLFWLPRFGGLDPYDWGVLKIISGATGVVGSLWAIVLLLRGARRGERVLLAFAIFLTAFWVVSIPMLGTWVSPERGRISDWDYLHLACVPLLVPLITMAVTLALPLFIWKYRRARGAEESVRSELQWRAWRLMLIVAGVLFSGVLPFAFYVYGGTMVEGVKGRHWTTHAAEGMPRGFGDASCRTLGLIPKRGSKNTFTLLIERGLVSPEFMIREIEDPVAVTRGLEQTFGSFARNYPNEALAWVRGKVKQSTRENLTRNMVHHFTKKGNDAEVHAFLELKSFDPLDQFQKIGAWQGLRERPNGSAFAPDMEALMDGNVESCMQALNFLFGQMDGTDAKRVYLKAIERGPEVLLHATYHLRVSGNGVIAGLQQADVMKQKMVMQALMASSSNVGGRRAKVRGVLSVYRIALQQALHSPDYVNRVMAALLIHDMAQALTPALVMQYKLLNPGERRFKLDPLNIHAVGAAENQALIEQARELLKQ